VASLLVTGGAGFIGSNFVHYWIGRHPGDRVIVLDALTYAGNTANLAGIAHPERLRFVNGDICDRELVLHLLRDEDIDTIVHFAAESHVDRSIAGPDVFVETNVRGTHVLLEAARAVWLGERRGSRRRRFHHVSTDEVYGSLGRGDAPFDERSPYAPSSPYAASKAASDMLVRAQHRTYGLEVTISNCTNNYGPRHFPEKLIPLMIVNALSGRPLPVYADGSNIRDWLYVSDHCRGIERILEDGRVGETYNIGGNTERTNLTIVKGICTLIDEAFASRADLRARFPDAAIARGRPSETLITFVADRPGHDFRYALDTRKIAAELGFEPVVTFEQGLRDTVDWYLENEAWWRAVLDGSYRARGTAP
jgi:dTDP-glucose 4,6-dehydratase